MRHDATGRVVTVLGRAGGTIAPRDLALTHDGAVIGLSFDADAAPDGAVEVVEFRSDDPAIAAGASVP